MAIFEVEPGESIAAAITAANIGDTVLLLAGTHVGGITLNKQLTLEGEDGSVVEPSVPGNESGVLIQSNNVVLRNLHLRNFSIGINTGSAQNNPRINVQVLGCHTELCTIHIKVNGTNWLVEDCDFDSVKWWEVGSGDADYMRIFGSGHVIRRNYFHGTDFVNDVGPDDSDEYAHVDAMQHFGNNGEILQNVLIEENFVTDFFQGIFFADGTAGSISNVVVRNNVFWGTELPDQFNYNGRPSWGIVFGKAAQPPVTGIEIYQNLIYNCNQLLAVRGNDAEALVENNIILGIGDVGTAYTDGGSTPSVTGTGDYVFGVNSLGDDFNTGENVEADPELVDDADPLGADDIFFTEDDGWLSAATDLGYGPQLDFGEGADVTPPVVSVIGSDTVAIGLSEVYNELGATALDNVDGAISVTTQSNLPLEGGVTTGARPTTVGTFLIIYSATDAADNTGTAQRSVTVVDDIIPVIMMNGPDEVELSQGDSYTDAGAAMLDNYEGDITNLMQTTIRNGMGQVVQAVDTDQLDTYTITYSGMDGEGNEATPVVRTVIVSQDAPALPVRNTIDGSLDPLRRLTRKGF